jgi:hypothetical protein
MGGYSPLCISTSIPFDSFRIGLTHGSGFTMLYTEKSSLSCSHASVNVGGTLISCRLLIGSVLVGISFYEYNPLGGGFFTGTILGCFLNPD